MSSEKALTETAVWTTTKAIPPARWLASLPRSVIVPEPTVTTHASASDRPVCLG